MLHDLMLSWFHWVETGGYFAIVVLMAMESSIFPVPSEIVMPPAAFLAAQGKLNIYLVVLAGTAGSYLGSAITYWIARTWGRPLILKYGKYVFCPPEKVEMAERFLQRYQAGGIFFARLLPVIRHLISIPAGIIRMPFGVFSAITIVGSLIWCSILSWYGVGVAERNPTLMEDPDALVHFIKAESIWLIAGIAILCALYVLVLQLTRKAPAKPAQ